MVNEASEGERGRGPSRAYGALWGMVKRGWKPWKVLGRSVNSLLWLLWREQTVRGGGGWEPREQGGWSCLHWPRQETTAV